MNGKLRNMTAIYLSRGDKMLLLYRVGSRVLKKPVWCGFGGHFEENELNNAKACAIRELWEETGIKEDDLKHLELRYITLRLKDNEVRQNYYFFADLKEGVEPKEECDEGSYQWVDYADLMNYEMPHTSEYVMRHYLEIGKNTDFLYGGITRRNDVLFQEIEDF